MAQIYKKESKSKDNNNQTDQSNQGVNGNPTEERCAHYEQKLDDLKIEGSRLRSDNDQPSLLSKPSWFNKDLFENAKSVYARHFMAINFAHLSGLLLLVRVNSIFATLKATGKSDSVSKLFNRYYQTIIHVKKWYEGDIFEENSEAYSSLLTVRGMHNKVSSNLNDCIAHKKPDVVINEEDTKLMKDEDMDHEQIHISEYNIMITQFAFVGFIVMRAKSIGLIEEFSQHDLESMLHFWRVIGYYLGASEKLNLCSRNLDDIKGLCDAITEQEFKRSIETNPLSSPPGVMSVNIVRSIKFIPMLTIYGMLKYLYQLLNIDTREFESRATRYSRLSHYLIGLVMSRLLAYKFLRWFNNGLTRLSVSLVGRYKRNFANYLDSKYGYNLKAM